MSAARVKSAEAAIASARARVRVTEEALENTNVRAPFDGVVIKKRAEVGETVSPFGVAGQASREGGAIATIADLGELEVQTEVSENSVAKLTAAMPAEVKLQAYPGSGLQGPAAADFSVGRSREGDRRGARHDSQRRRAREAGDDRQRHVPGNAANGARPGVRPRRPPAAPAAPIVLIPKRRCRAERRDRSSGSSPAAPRRAGRSSLGPDRIDQIEVKSGVVPGEAVILNPPPALTDRGARSVKGNVGDMALIELRDVTKSYKRDAIEIPVLSRYVDGIMIRTFAQDDVEELARTPRSR